MSDHGLAGRRALVTGASSGFGAHFARLLAAEGAHVAIGARRREKLADLKASLEAAGAREVLSLPLDVTDAASVSAAMDKVAARFGGLDILVNNAGIAETARAAEVTPDLFDRILGTNLRGAWLAATEAARIMRAGAGGSIVNIASILGLRVAGAVAPYAISKAGVVQMTHALALEFARDRIRVNALAPGYFGTEINAGFFETEAGQAMLRRVPMRRLGELSDLDGPFLLLCSDASRFMTGAVIPVDGGHLVSSL